MRSKADMSQLSLPQMSIELVEAHNYGGFGIDCVADITILLALSVFQTIVNASLPPTSDAVPLLCTPLYIHLYSIHH